MKHRALHPAIPFPENLLVARPAGRQEILQNDKARAALRKEWDRRRAIGTWDEANARECQDVVAEAKKERHHIRRDAILCNEDTVPNTCTLS